MIESFRMALRQLQRQVLDPLEQLPRTARDLSLQTVAVGVAVIAFAMAGVPHVFGGFDTLTVRTGAALCVVVFAFFFVTVSSRIVGLVGVTSNPTSGMTIASLIGTSLVFVAAGWTDQAGMATALAVGCVVAIAASIAGDTSQDLKTGFLLGATPRRQQIGELIGVLTSAAFVCLTLLLLDRAYGLGSAELPAPQATLMKLVIEGVLQAKLPWGLVAIGALIAVAAELIRIPSLPFAVGVYLPVSTMVPVFLGGGLRFLMERRATTEDQKVGRRERGVLLGSGLVGGEGLMGVIVAGVVGAAIYFSDVQAGAGGTPPIPLELGHDWAADAPAWFAGAPELLAVVTFALLITFFARRCRG